MRFDYDFAMKYFHSPRKTIIINARISWHLLWLLKESPWKFEFKWSLSVQMTEEIWQRWKSLLLKIWKSCKHILWQFSRKKSTKLFHSLCFVKNESKSIFPLSFFFSSWLFCGKNNFQGLISLNDDLFIGSKEINLYFHKFFANNWWKHVYLMSGRKRRRVLQNSI